MSARRRVVITGLGAVTPLGNDVPTFWESLCAGRSGVGPVTRFDATGFRTRIAAEVRNFVPADDARSAARRMDRHALFALAAAQEAWNDACLSQTRLDPYETGVLIGSSHGGEEAMLAEVDAALHRRRVSGRLIPRMLGNMAAAQVAMRFGLHGPSFAIASACATGAHAIGEAAEIIRRGDAEVMLGGGADACITPLTFAGDEASGALSTRNDAPAAASRPFDAARDGFVIGEGAGVLVLEEWDHAARRGARIYAELAGYAATTDALHETRPDPSGVPVARAIQRALQRAGVAPSALGAVFAHATGTPLGDPAEATALTLALGDAVERVPVTAIKGALGHLMGAAGAVQAVAATKAIEQQLLPPILNLDSPDPACPLRFLVGKAAATPLTSVLSNAIGFGGHNACLVLTRA